MSDNGLSPSAVLKLLVLAHRANRLAEEYGYFSPAQMVADLLYGMGIRGERQASESCPLAVYCHPIQPDVDISPESMDDAMADEGEERFVLNEFIRLFDRGHFPELELQET